MSYNGWKLSEQSRNELLARIPPIFSDVVAHHITLKRGNQFICEDAECIVVGYALDPNGIEALVVSVNGTTQRPDGETYHITWSLDRAAGYRPASSLSLLDKEGFMEILPFRITVEPFYVDNEGNEITATGVKYSPVGLERITQEDAPVEALQRCSDAGHDPYSTPEGYPLWVDYTDETITKRGRR